MATRNGTNRINHREQRQTESQRDAGKSDSVARQDRAATTSENQYEGSYELSNIAFHFFAPRISFEFGGLEEAPRCRPGLVLASNTGAMSNGTPFSEQGASSNPHRYPATRSERECRR